MMLSDHQRTLLSLIEQGLRELEKLKLACIESEKRIKKLKSAKFLEPATRELNAMEARIRELEKQTSDDTAELFVDACGILPDGVATLYDANNNEKGTVIVQMMRARQLDDGTAVLSIGGDTINAKTEAGVYSLTGPSAVLVAAEVRGEYLEGLT